MKTQTISLALLWALCSFLALPGCSSTQPEPVRSDFAHCVNQIKRNTPAEEWEIYDRFGRQITAKTVCARYL